MAENYGILVKERVSGLLGLDTHLFTLDQVRHSLQMFLKDHDMDYPENKDIIVLTKMVAAIKGEDHEKITKGFLKDLVPEIEEGEEDPAAYERKTVERMRKDKTKLGLKSAKRAREKQNDNVDLSLDRWSNKFGEMMKKLTKRMSKKCDVRVTFHKSSAVFKFGTNAVFSLNEIKWSAEKRSLYGVLQFNKAVMYNDDKDSDELIDLVKHRLKLFDLDPSRWGHTWKKGEKVLKLNDVYLKDIEKYMGRTITIWVK